MKILGFQSGHDVSYCILENGVPTIHEEMERFTREKEPPGCGLKFFFERNPDMKDINAIAFGNPHQKEIKGSPGTPDPIDKDSLIRALEMVGTENYFTLSHHACHAANAFYTSDHKKCVIFTVDGGGHSHIQFTPPSDFAELGWFQLSETLTVWKGEGEHLVKLNNGLLDMYHDAANQPIDGIAVGNTILQRGVNCAAFNRINLGRLWNNITKHVFGLSTEHPIGNQAGTVMAMATYGKPVYLNMFNAITDSNHDADFYKDTSDLYRALLEIGERSEQDRFNIAASLQKYTENTFFDIMSSWIDKETHSVGFSGGASLNCVMLGKVKKRFPHIKNVFCDPVPYDGGLSIGAARLVWHKALGGTRTYNNPANRSPYLGKTYKYEEVIDACDAEQNASYSVVTDDDVIKLIDDQKIVAVFGGGAESGRRALGNRSILADPRSSEMRDIINQKVKHRQWFRPFAPSVLSEHVSEWFEEDCESPYMSVALKFKEHKQELVPSVVHHDGTGRVQSVEKDLNKWYHSFISKWNDLTGVPILLNTSFNDREPIVETPEHAIKCYMGTNIDYLYFYDYNLLLTRD